MLVLAGSVSAQDLSNQEWSVNTRWYEEGDTQQAFEANYDDVGLNVHFWDNRNQPPAPGDGLGSPAWRDTSMNVGWQIGGQDQGQHDPEQPPEEMQEPEYAGLDFALMSIEIHASGNTSGIEPLRTNEQGTLYAGMDRVEPSLEHQNSVLRWGAQYYDVAVLNSTTNQTINLTRDFVLTMWLTDATIAMTQTLDLSRLSIPNMTTGDAFSIRLSFRFNTNFNGNDLGPDPIGYKNTFAEGDSTVSRFDFNRDFVYANATGQYTSNDTAIDTQNWGEWSLSLNNLTYGDVTEVNIVQSIKAMGFKPNIDQYLEDIFGEGFGGDGGGMGGLSDLANFGIPPEALTAPVAIIGYISLAMAIVFIALAAVGSILNLVRKDTGDIPGKDERPESHDNMNEEMQRSG